MTEEPTIAVSMSRKINLGNFESADCFVSVSGIKAGMTAADIAPLMETGKVAWEQVRAALVRQLGTIQRNASEEQNDRRNLRLRSALAGMVRRPRRNPHGVVLR